MDCIVHGVAKSWTGLSDFHFTSLQRKLIRVSGSIQYALALSSLESWFILQIIIPLACSDVGWTDA